jgi:hypothetical protein
MNSNDEKTVIGESAFNQNATNQTNSNVTSEQKNEFKNQETATIKDSSKSDNKKNTSKGKVVAGVAAAAGIAGVAGVAAGTAYSEEIKSVANDLLGKENPTTMENPETGESAPIEIDNSKDSIDNIQESIPVENMPNGDNPGHITLNMNGENGEAIAMNLVDDNMDGVADHVQLIENDQIVGEYTPDEFNSFLTGESIEDPIIDEGITYGEPDVIFDESLSSEGEYAAIDYAAFEDTPMEELSIDDGGEYLTSDEVLDGQNSVYVDESELIASEDYSLETESSGDDYLAQNDEMSSNDYESQLDSTDFDSMNEYDDFSSTDTDFSSDII